jgi:hypothetical protein
MQRRITRIWRHPAVTFIWAPLFLAVFWVSLCKIVEVSQLAASGDPVQIADWGLTHKVSRDDFEREIRATLAEGKVDLAQGILTEALKHKMPIDAALIDSVQEASAKQDSAAVRTARAVTVGLLTGKLQMRAASQARWPAMPCFLGTFGTLAARALIAYRASAAIRGRSGSQRAGSPLPCSHMARGVPLRRSAPAFLS